MAAGTGMRKERGREVGAWLLGQGGEERERGWVMAASTGWRKERGLPADDGGHPCLLSWLKKNREWVG